MPGSSSRLQIEPEIMAIVTWRLEEDRQCDAGFSAIAEFVIRLRQEVVKINQHHRIARSSHQARDGFQQSVSETVGAGGDSGMPSSIAQAIESRHASAL